MSREHPIKKHIIEYQTGNVNKLPRKQSTGCYSKRHKLHLPLSCTEQQLPIQQDTYDGLVSLSTWQ